MEQTTQPIKGPELYQLRLGQFDRHPHDRSLGGRGSFGVIMRPPGQFDARPPSIDRELLERHHSR